MNDNKKGGLGNDMGSLLERREQKNKRVTSNEEVKSVLLEEIYDNINKQPRISFWDVESKILLNYLKETKPKFSISKEISNILHEHFKNKYPEIWNEILQIKKP